MPVLKQEWENSCGPTALAMVLQFYHENISEKDIRKTLNMSIDDLGVTPLQLGNVARKVGFVADVEDSCDIPTIEENLSNGVPAIVLIDQGYFIGNSYISMTQN